MKQFVLIHDEQMAIRPQTAADAIRKHGFRKAAEHYGVSESTIRKFMHEAGYRFSRSTSWQVERLPGLETDASTATEAAARTDEPTGTPVGS